MPILRKSKREEDRIVLIKQDPGSGVIPGILLGMVAGAVIGLLRAPSSGEELRDRLLGQAQKAKTKAQDRVSDKTYTVKSKTSRNS